MENALLRPSEQTVMDALARLADENGVITDTKLQIAREAGYDGSEQAARQRIGRVLLSLENAGRIRRSYESITGKWAIHIV